MRRLAHLISKIFHPMFSPLLAFAITALASKTDLFYNNKQLFFIFAIIAVITVVLPFLSIIFLKWVGLVTHLELSNRSERILPLFLSAIFIWGCSGLLYKIHYPISLVIYFRLAALLIVISTFITLFWKISLHGLGWGIITAIAFIVTGFNGNGYFIIFPIAILLSGIVASSRLYMGAHTPTQIYCGYGLGFSGVFTGILFQSALINFLI